MGCGIGLIVARDNDWIGDESGEDGVVLENNWSGTNGLMEEGI